MSPYLYIYIIRYFAPNAAISVWIVNNLTRLYLISQSIFNIFMLHLALHLAPFSVN